MYAQPLRSSSPDIYHGKYAASLFASGEQGVWYDPSDFSTMFQDAAGATPVTAVEQPVGRILDKSGRGNHATQTTTASRPVLSARVNQLLNTENLANTYWRSYQTSATPNFAVNHLGVQSATLVVATTANSEHLPTGVSFNVSAGVSYKLSFWIKKHTTSSGLINFGLTGSLFNWGGEVEVNLNSGSIGSAGGVVSNTSIRDQGNGWFLVSMTTTAPATGTAGMRIRLKGYSGELVFAGDGVSGVYIWGVDLRVANESTLIPGYQRVNTATDYDTQGFPLYLRFDGVDDWLVTPSIDFTATDKMTVFAGVRKLSDATPGYIVGQSLTNTGFQLIAAATSASDGSTSPFSNFSLLAHATASGAFQSYVAYTTTNSFPSPFSAIISSGINLAIANRQAASMRINGIVPSRASDSLSGSLLSGNFLNIALNIGRSINGNIPFNGRLYGLIVRGAQTDNLHLTNVERYLANKSGVAL